MKLNVKFTSSKQEVHTWYKLDGKQKLQTVVKFASAAPVSICIFAWEISVGISSAHYSKMYKSENLFVETNLLRYFSMTHFEWNARLS